MDESLIFQHTYNVDLIKQMLKKSKLSNSDIRNKFVKLRVTQTDLVPIFVDTGKITQNDIDTLFSEYIKDTYTSEYLINLASVKSIIQNIEFLIGGTTPGDMPILEQLFSKEGLTRENYKEIIDYTLDHPNTYITDIFLLINDIGHFDVYDPDIFYLIIEKGKLINLDKFMSRAPKELLKSKRFAKFAATHPNFAKYVIEPILLKKLHHIKKRKYREKITKSDNVYRWEEICSGKINIPFRELFQYILDIAMILNNLKKEDIAVNKVKKILLERYRDSKLPPKRMACIDIIYMVNKYYSYIESIECTNDLITEDSIADIPIGQLITFTEDGQTYCFTVGEMQQMDINPYNRKQFPQEVLNMVKNQQGYKDWVYDRNQRAREDLLKDNIVYSSLWNMLSIEDYPISETDFKNMSPDRVNDVYALIRQNAGNFSNSDILNQELNYSDIHVDFARKMVNFLNNQQDSDFNGKKVLVNEVLRQSLGN